MAKLSDTDIKQAAINIVKLEKQSWENSTVFVTEKVAFNMRNFIRALRKNYYGIFDEPNDPVTGHEKIWIPLTESMVNNVVKNIDLDTKDINIRALKPTAIGYTSIVRYKLRKFLSDTMFGEGLDLSERQLAIDGTTVTKVLTERYKGKTIKKTCNVDILNTYIDPSAESIQKAYRFTERALLTVAEVMSMKGWMNTDGLQGTFNNNPTDPDLMGSSAIAGTTKLVNVYETWGKIPKSLITGDAADKDEEVEGHIVVSGIDNPGMERVHLIELNKEECRPYEESWYERVPGRWHGRGVAEKCFNLQRWLNTVVNVRITRHRVSQLGLWKIKANSGITPQSMSRLAANGVVKVKEMDDIEQIPMQEASESSYRDEEVINGWAQKNTSAYDAAVGEALPASTPATNAAIQNTNAQSAFVLIKESLGLYLQRLINHHILPTLIKGIKQGDIIQLTGDPEEIRAMDEAVVNQLLYQELNKMNEMGVYVSAEQAQMEKARLQESVARMGYDRYIEVLDEIDPSEYESVVFVTNEEISKPVLAANLMQALQLVPEQRTVLLRQMFDIMGLDSSLIKEQPPMMEAQTGQAPQPSAPNMQQIATQANTMAGAMAPSI